MKKQEELNDPDIKTLFAVNDAIALTRNKTALFDIIFKKLKPIFNFMFASIMLYDKSRSYLEIMTESTYGSRPDQAPRWIRISVSEIPFPLSLNKITTIKISDLIKQRGQMINELHAAKAANVKETVLCPLNSGGEVIGFLIFASQSLDTITKNKMDFLKKISNPIATAVSNITAYEELLQREKEKELQLNFSNSLVGIKNRDEMFYTLASEIQKIDRFRYIGMVINHPDIEKRSSHLFYLNSKGLLKSIDPVPHEDFDLVSSYSKSGSNTIAGYASVNIPELLGRSSFFRELNKKTPFESVTFASGSIDDFSMSAVLINPGPRDTIEPINHLSHASSQITLALRNLFAFEENEKLRRQLEQEKHILLDEIKISGGSQDIIGTSAGIKKVLKQVKQVAKTDTTILVQGETGVGKELIAKALHNNSTRKDKVFITVNCASLPSQLVESELFGHEKGSYTGAIERRIGKFELANGGTIFLDEIGEVPLELQAKLLRVLQEKEFERIGGKELLHTDIRIIAATNRNLQKEITLGRFRPDLYFRLNVFPITIPALRERTEDIPLFVKYFTEKHSKRVGAPLRIVSESDMNLLMQYNWPGNIRELEHIIERAVITSTGHFLEFTGFMGPLKINEETSPEDFKNLIDLEREHIIAALKLTNGRISGDKGAAKLLGLNNKTLDSRIKKLGIKKSIVLS